MLSNEDDKKFFKIVFEISEGISSDTREQEINEELYGILARIDRIQIREYPEILSDIMRESIKQSSEAYRKELSGTHGYSEFALDVLPCQGDSSEYVNNYLKLVPPFITSSVNIPENIKKLYAETRWCFVFEQYNAAVALSRAIIEVALKTDIGLSLEDTRNKAGKVLGWAKEVKLINKQDCDLGKKIIDRANDILHKADIVATEGETLEIINSTKDFLESFYNRARN